MKVVKILDPYNFVINAGSLSGLKNGTSVLIYIEGEEIVDPDTNTILGKLEIPKVNCLVTHVQDNISIVSNKSFIKPSNFLALALTQNSIDRDPFSFLTKEEKEVKIGDLAKILE